ncbi:SsgA family sporulation/cell division regulator [Streptomyces sp. NPDC097727]|uniref:SsgA family sporulation/cell division regulator n=1 Tax=Streptomyces sp. NPDC097727 TaxID=3366092 RepID=UPI003821ED0E
MNGEQFGVRAGQAALSGELSALRLDIRRVLDGVPRQPVRAEFRFDPGTPMVVSLTLTPWHGAAVTWRIGRELLYRGLYEESGEGDVQAWPTQCEEGDAAWLLLESGESSAVFELPVAEVEEWLDASYGIVSAEAEADALDWDTFIGELLEDRGRTDD